MRRTKKEGTIWRNPHQVYRKSNGKIIEGRATEEY
jgi:hypothetical protein